MGDMSFRLIFPRSDSPMKRPNESSSLMTIMKGSHRLQNLILGRGSPPLSRSLIIWRSVPSNHDCEHGYVPLSYTTNTTYRALVHVLH